MSVFHAPTLLSFFSTHMLIPKCQMLVGSFAQHFCNRLGPAYLALKNVLDDANPVHGEVLNDIKKRFREETFTRQGISETILAYPDLVRLSLEHERAGGG
jgi:hypothetical protein